MTAPPLTCPPSGGLMAVTETFAAIPDAVPQARALTRALGKDQQDTAALVVSELVTNAVVHAETSTVTVELISTDHGLSIEVSDDDSAHLPEWEDAGPSATHGRGLFIVKCLCSELHCDAGPDGKTMSALIECGADAH
ncbi:ATP-binding protein [Streptomyces sp. SID13726]|uniref:ATP-binding protein n=1 Tax=Streptomyces sp. SID13726 TaxID=2706058 RepID=UPI0013BBD3AF|nr:ATP-binding protein [Streptomyces sp. SID13726]NEB04494.1 ATP-binding protein [Streptomyces sp. SID13726]